MANEKNLKHFTSNQSHEEAVKNGRAGGIASGEAKRRAKTLKELAQAWLEAPVTKDKDSLTGGQFMMAIAAKEIAKGNPKFWELMRDTAGQKPVDKVMVSDVSPEVMEEVESIINGIEQE